MFISKLIIKHNEKPRNVSLKYTITEGEGRISKYEGSDVVTLTSPKVEIKVVATTRSKQTAEATLICRQEHPIVKGYYRDSVRWKSMLSKRDANRAAFSFVEADPKLPNVLIIGNSISIGYTPFIRQELEGAANVYRIHTNALSTEFALNNIAYWLSDMRWDVIHVNWGLHDLKYVISDTQQDVLPAEYRKNLRELLTYIEKHTSAKIIWAQTTYVPSGVKPHRDNSDVILYNSIALEVLSDFPNIVVDDHYALSSAEGNLKFQVSQNVHFKPAGYKKLGIQSAKAIRSALRK